MRTYAMVFALVAAALILAACGDDPPPTQIVIVVSPTPETETPEPPVTATADATAEPQPTAISPTEAAPETDTPEPPPAPSATPRPDIFPTDAVAEVQLAEQVFEHGRMFWIRHTRQIWVMVSASPDTPGGDWFCYNDTFQEGEPEIDESLIPPEGMYQPRRGFGKLWRSHAELKDALGWALTPEFELTSQYTYVAGGYVQDGQYFPGPGEHRLTTLYDESISFFESDIRGDCLGGTWRMTAAP